MRRAVALSGGGARGAYEAGVLEYVFRELPASLGYVPRFDVFSGTSVGAVHACFLAAYADRPVEGARALAEVWKSMSFGRVYQFGWADALSFSRTMTGFLTGSELPYREIHAERIHGLLNTSPLEKLVVGQIPWRRMRRNVHTGRVHTVCVATTEIATGRTVVFVDNRERTVPAWTRDLMTVARSARIGPVHALGSAAIPFLFPAVRIDDLYYCDGSLRQQTPLAPALRLGSNRVLAIGLRSEPTLQTAERLAEERLEHFRSAGFLFGKVLNALLIDRLEYDLGQMRVINRVLRGAVAAGGDESLEEINRRVEIERGLGLRVVEDCFVRPSRDIGTITADHVRRLRKKNSYSRLGRIALRALTRGSPDEEADLMSYLLFDGDYARDLIELGFNDAARQHDELVEFFRK